MTVSAHLEFDLKGEAFRDEQLYNYALGGYNEKSELGRMS